MGIKKKLFFLLCVFLFSHTLFAGSAGTYTGVGAGTWTESFFLTRYFAKKELLSTEEFLHNRAPSFLEESRARWSLSYTLTREWVENPFNTQRKQKRFAHQMRVGLGWGPFADFDTEMGLNYQTVPVLKVYEVGFDFYIGYFITWKGVKKITSFFSKKLKRKERKRTFLKNNTPSHVQGFLSKYDASSKLRSAQSQTQGPTLWIQFNTQITRIIHGGENKQELTENQFGLETILSPATWISLDFQLLSNSFSKNIFDFTTDLISSNALDFSTHISSRLGYNWNFFLYIYPFDQWSFQLGYGKSALALDSSVQTGNYQVGVSWTFDPKWSLFLSESYALSSGQGSLFSELNLSYFFDTF